jgi:hypothetical protein
MFSCKDQKEIVCDCMKNYEIRYESGTIVQETITCIEDQGIELSLENDETGQLIYDMNQVCPKGSRKFWKLCQNLDEGVIQ